MKIKAYLSERQNRVNHVLTNVILPNKNTSPQHLHEAMHYGVMNGGKRIRPILVYATGEAFGVDNTLLDLPAGAIELIHAYSLVHDDLPSMDDDDLRRGVPTCHKVYDEATAILVGDALQTLAFSTLSEYHSILSPQIRIAMVNCLAKAAGSLGMAGGQALDLRATGQQIQIDELQQIHSLKTGALIAAAVRLGTIAAQITDSKIVDRLDAFANHIGLCFQIQDDILNEEGDSALLGKDIGTDLSKQKATYVTMSSTAKAKEKLQFHYLESLRALEPLGDTVSTLKALAEYMIDRDH
jgi:geranylgeranyl pyrophosphate synthase